MSAAPYFDNTIDSTGCGNGALVVAGGASIGDSLYVCGRKSEHGCTGGNALNVPNGSVGIGGNLNVCGTALLQDL